MGYPTQDTTNDFPALPIPPKKQQPTADDFPILEKKSPVGGVPSKVGGQVGTSVPQDVHKLRNLSDISISPQQQQDIKNYTIATDKEHKAKVNNAINTTTDFYRAATKFATGKENEFQNDVPREQQGEHVQSFLNNPNVIERAKTDPQFAKQYKEAKFNWINDFPEAAQKNIEQKIGQHLEDTHKTGILYNNPGKEKVDKAVDELAMSGDLDPHEVYKYKQDIRPNVGTTKSLLFGSPIPTSDYVNTISKSLERSGGNIVEGIRDAADKISMGTISKFGESRAAHQTRVLNDIYSQPQVESKASEGNKLGLNIADMVGFALPAVLGEMAGVPTMATLGTQFYGQNKKDGMQLYPDNENKQDAYAALTTGIDLIAGEKLPVKGLGESIRGLVDDAAAGTIAKDAAQNKYLGFINDLVKGGVQGANALEVMKIGHNAANAVFGGRNFNLEEQAKEVLKSYPQDALAMSFFSGIGAATKNFGKSEPIETKPTEESLYNQILDKADEGYKTTLKAAENEQQGMDYINDKAAEDPVKFRKDFGDDITDKVISQIPVEKFEKALDFLLDKDPENSNVKELDKIITDKSKQNEVPTSDAGVGELPTGQENRQEVRGGQPEGQRIGQESSQENNAQGQNQEEKVTTTPKETVNEGDITLGENKAEVPKVTWHRGVTNRNRNEGDKFFSADKSTAHDYAVEKPSDKPEMTKLSKEEHPKNPLVIGSKEDLADKIGFPEENIYDLKGDFDKKAKEYAQSKGYDAIIYESGSMGNPEMHLFGKSETLPPTKEEVPEPITEGGEGTGIAHAATEETRKKYGLGDYERNNATDAELEQAAEEAISKGYNPETLISQMEKGVPPTGTENFILKKYKATLEAQFEKNPTDENLGKIERLVKATDKIGSLQSEAFRTRRGLEPVDDSRAGFFINELAANNDAPLTEGQKKTANEEYDKLNEARKKLDEDTKALEQKVAAFRAEQELAKTKNKTKRSTKKTHEDFVKERNDIAEAAKKKIEEAKERAKGISKMGVGGRTKIDDLFIIAPEVLKLVKSYAEEGISKLGEVVKGIHEQFKDVIEGLEEKDVHDIIAGEYNKKKEGTKKEALAIAENLRIEAQLINKLAKLENGEIPKNPQVEIKRNQEIHDLRKRIADKRRENPDYEGKLKQLTERNKKEAQRIKDKIENGEYEPEAKSTPLLQQRQLREKYPQEFLRAQRSQDALIKVRNEIAIRRLKQMYENKSPQEKTMEIFAKTLNVPRTMMASFDFSAPLRQGIVASAAHPVMASKALRFMFEAAKDEKVYNRWLDVVHNSGDRWTAAQKTDLGITDPASLHLKEKEEAFQGAPYAEKIPIIGLGIKASERAYIGYLNHLRWNLFNMYADRFEAMGKTYENNPELYKGISSFINSSTGRGNLEGKLNNAAPLLNSFLFATKLMASRINMLGLSDIPNLVVRGATLGKRGLDYGFYTKLPKEIRIEALKDMAKFVGVGMSILLTAKMMGANVEDDPRSSDFGKIHVGNTRWDIWGGFQPYARVLTQFITGERKATTTGDIQELNGKGFMGQNRATPLTSFLRGKLAPVPGTAWNLIEGSDVVGNKVTPQGELLKTIVPLLGQDIYQGMQDQGAKAIFTVGIPSAFGVGVQTFQPKVGQGGGKSGGAGAKGDFKKSTHKQQKHN